MDRWMRFLGILGVVLFLFGVIGIFTIGANAAFPTIRSLMFVHLVGGVVLILVWFGVSGMKNMDSAGKVIRGRSVRFGANAVLYSVVFVALLCIANWAAKKFNIRWDLTEQGVYSLSDQSANVVSKLPKPLKIVGFKTGQMQDADALEDLFRLLRTNGNDKVTAELINPYAKPELVEKYEMKPGNVIYLQYGEGADVAVSRINDTSEEGITNAIIKLTRGAAKKLYYVQGHDEPDLTSTDPLGLKSFNDAIVDEHMAIEGIFLSEKGAVPADAAALMLVSPRKALLPQERDLIVKYVQDGGRLLLFTDPRSPDDVRVIADSFGITIGNDVVIDQVQRLFAAPQLGAQPMVREYGQHAITKNMTARSITVFNIASTVAPKSKDNTSGVTYTELAKSSSSAWGETNLAKVFESEESVAENEADDAKGPLSLAVAYEKKLPGETKEGEAAEEKVQRVVVFGDSDWILNANFNVYAHRDFALNAVSWLGGEEGGISIRPRSIRTPELSPISEETYLLMMSLSFVIPELILITGLLIWWQRRTVLA